MVAPSTKRVVDFELATSYRRSVARLIDLGVGFTALMTIGGLFTVLMGMVFKLSKDASGTVFVVIWVLLLVVYDLLMQRLLGKTLGKMLLGLRVVDGKGERLSWGNCILRAILTYLLAAVIIFLTGVTASLFGWIFIGNLGRYRRFPHDTATRSFVVREIKGQLARVAEAGMEHLAAPGPLTDLEGLYKQGMITQEELERKKKEIGIH